ncbi:TlpA family protein disulfide reductase [Ekhidna sp.]
MKVKFLIYNVLFTTALLSFSQYKHPSKNRDELNQRIKEHREQYKINPPKSKTEEILRAENLTGLALGTAFPKLNYRSTNDEHFKFDSLYGKLVVVNFWFVGCVGCKLEEDNLKKLVQHFSGNRDIKFIGLSRSDLEKTSNYLNKHGDFGYEVLCVDDSKVYDQAFNILTFPSHMILDDEGFVIKNFTLPIYDQEVLEAYIKELESLLSNLD